MRKGISVASLVMLAGCNPFASSWADDCETAFKERLLSPATYKRIETDLFGFMVPLEEYIASKGTDLSASQQEDLRKRKPPVKNWKVWITYDANNAMGVPIRDKFYCEETNTTGKEPAGGRDKGSLLLMKVNGKSMHDLQMDAVRKQFGK